MKIQNILLCLVLFVGIFLRFYNLAENPPGLYIDEVSIGYNAYSILKTGTDEHKQSFPLFFEAFGEYKMPAFIYSVSIAMSIFGKNEFAVRFPSALAGSLTIVILYLIIKKILELDKSKMPSLYRRFIPIISSFLLAISPWHIQFSRGGFEVTLALFFYLIGIYLTLIFFEKRKFRFLSLAIIFYILSIYTYNTFRILCPLTFFVVSAITIIKFPKLKNRLLINIAVFIVLFVPIIMFSTTSGGQARFAQTSAFSEYKINSLILKIIYYPIIYVKNYLSFFSLQFLFGNGDGNGRHQIHGFGLLYIWQIPILFTGLYFLIMLKKSMLKKLTLFILFASPIPAAIASPSPHSLRGLILVIPLTVVCAVGVIYVLNLFKKRRNLVIVFSTLIFAYQFVIYAHFYYFHYPIVNSLD